MYFFTRFILSKALASRRQVQKDDNIVHNKQTNKQGYFTDDPV